MPPPIRVLIADDDARFRTAITALLETEGFEIVGAAENGVEAVELAESLNPDVITMDLQMPVMSGVEATRLICAKPNAPPIVILSGSSSSEELDHALAAGARSHVQKGDAIAAIAPALRAAVSR